MLSFTYTARDTASNKQVKSTVKAESERAAAKLLMAQGMVPLEIKEQGDSGSIIEKITNRVSTKDRIVFIRQLATLINAGLPLAQSLRTVQDQTENKKLKSVVQDVISSIESGKSLSESFAKHPKYFSDVFIALIAAGEVSGTLDQALERVADQQEKDAEIMGKVRGAMVYPGIVSFVMLAVIIFMLVAVVPQIEKLYDDLNQSLPFISQVMVNLAAFLMNFWWLVIIALGIGGYFLIQYVKTDNGRRWLDAIKINMPLFGLMFKKLYMARFMRTGQTLMATGVPMLETLNICARAVNNVHIEEAIRRSAEKVKGGKALSTTLKSEQYILPLVPQMLSIGEQSGGIDTMMGKAASFYENELDQTIKSISVTIEPIMMVMLAGVAGLMVGAILFPVYNLVGSGAVR